MAMRCSSILALGGVLAVAVRDSTHSLLHSHHPQNAADSGSGADFGSVADFQAREFEKQLTPVACGDAWGPVPPPQENDRISKYTLEKCFSAEPGGEAWTATSDDDGETVWVKIVKGTIALRLEYFRKECLVAQMAVQRDPAHFVDCLEYGTDTAGSAERIYTVWEAPMGTTYYKRHQVKAHERFWMQLKPLVSIWTQFVFAWETFFHTSSADHFKILPVSIQASTALVDFDSESREPRVKIAFYGGAHICCASSEPAKCTASLRAGTTTMDLPPETIRMCKDPASWPPVALAAGQKSAMLGVAYMVLDAKSVIALGSRVSNPEAASRELATNPEEYLVEALKDELDSAQPEVQALFKEVLRLTLNMFETVAVEKGTDVAQALENTLPADLIGELRELHALFWE